MKTQTKAEFYKSLIEIHKKGGQGLSGIVRVHSTEYGEYLDEFIKEGLIECCDTGGSIGHDETNKFYMPTKGYNVWKDNEPGDRYKGRNLTFVRYYLDANNETDSPVNPSRMTLTRNPDFMLTYAHWLIKNEKDLKVMLSLDDLYYEKEISFTTDEIAWIKDRQWYTDNEKVSECLVQSKDMVSKIEEILNLQYQLKDRMSRDTKYSKELEKLLNDIKGNEDQLSLRKKLHRWFGTYLPSAKIQTLIK